LSDTVSPEQIRRLPAVPGVYLMKDAKGAVIYVGKAINLHSRVSSYFQSSGRLDEKTRRLVAHVATLDYMVTDSEQQALLLEMSLIKAHRPYYNIRLKDDKSFPYLKIDRREDFPRLTVTRQPKDDGGYYLGPFADAKSLRRTVRLLNRIFPLRHCRKPMNREYPRACLWHHLGKCPAPCIGAIGKPEYAKITSGVIRFLEGKQDHIIRELEAKMEKASETLDFEAAAVYRDQLQAIGEVIEGNRQAAVVRGEQDVIAFVRDDNHAYAEVFFIRNSRLTGREHFILQGTSQETPEAIMAGFLKQFYAASTYIPKRILLQNPADDAEIIREWLQTKKGSAVSLIVPRRGQKKQLMELVIKNAGQSRERQHVRQMLQPRPLSGALEELAEKLKLPAPPGRIEGYDISNIQGKSAVGSMVVFENGLPKTSAYRRFRIKTVPQADDYAMLREVIGRRFKPERRHDPNWPSPDLVLIDGGKGQLNAVHRAFRDTGVSDVPLASLAKQREEIFLTGRSRPVILPRTSPGLRLLQQVRDESHRFAIGYHHRLHRKRSLASALDDIPGIGPVRKRALLRQIGPVNKIRGASLEAIAAIKGMNSELARRVKEYLG
jgi:excinuclease ABC subunit C